jgi:hypothetical protein
MKLEMRTRRSTVAAAAGFVVVAILGGIALGSGTKSGRGTDPAFRGPILPGECGGEQVSLSEAAVQAHHALLVPDHKLASIENLTSAEWCEVSNLLVLTFSTGVRVEMMPSEISDPAFEFAAQEATYSDVTAGSIRDEPAAFTEPGATDAASIQPAPGGVEFVEEDLLVDVVGNGSIALDDLKSVTESLAPYVATSPSAA